MSVTSNFNSLITLKHIIYDFIIPTPKKKQVVKIKVRSQKMTDLNDPSMKANIFKKVSCNASIFILFYFPC